LKNLELISFYSLSIPYSIFPSNDLLLEQYKLSLGMILEQKK